MDRELSYEDQLKSNTETNEAFYKRMDEAAKGSAANQTFFEAAKKARIGIEADGLMPYWRDLESRYQAQQGIKAACLTREDVIALGHIQYAVLKRLDRNRNYMWVIICLLIYIASQFK